MRTTIKDFPLTIQEVKDLMKQEKSKKCMWIVVAISVISILVAVIIWVANKKDKDLEEHYEYFDDEYDDEYEDFDENIYEDDKDEIEYVKIKDFINYAEDEKQNEELNALNDENEEK